jgi:hypothetical protein
MIAFCRKGTAIPHWAAASRVSRITNRLGEPLQFPTFERLRRIDLDLNKVFARTLSSQIKHAADNSPAASLTIPNVMLQAQWLLMELCSQSESTFSSSDIYSFSL